MFPRLSLAPLVQLVHAKRVCWFVFYPSLLREGRGLGGGMLNKSREGAGGILAALDKKSPALAPSLSHQLPIPAFFYPAPRGDG